MATKKKAAEPAVTEEVIEETAADPEEYVEIELFADNDKYMDDLFVCVNGETCKIQRGVPVKVKRKFVEVIRNSEQQDRKTASLIRELTSGRAKDTELQ